MKRLILIAALVAAAPAWAQERAPDPEVIVEDTAPVAGGVIVPLLALLVLVGVMASAGD